MLVTTSFDLCLSLSVATEGHQDREALHLGRCPPATAQPPENQTALFNPVPTPKRWEAHTVVAWNSKISHGDFSRLTCKTLEPPSWPARVEWSCHHKPQPSEARLQISWVTRFIQEPEGLYTKALMASGLEVGREPPSQGCSRKERPPEQGAAPPRPSSPETSPTPTLSLCPSRALDQAPHRSSLPSEPLCRVPPPRPLTSPAKHTASRVLAKIQPNAVTYSPCCRLALLKHFTWIIPPNVHNRETCEPSRPPGPSLRPRELSQSAPSLRAKKE